MIISGCICGIRVLSLRKPVIGWKPINLMIISLKMKYYAYPSGVSCVSALFADEFVLDSISCLKLNRDYND